MKFFSADEYQAACIERFHHYLEVLTAALPNARIEHIGSSAIPNAISKGDLDIFVGIDALELEFAAQQIASLGFREKQDTLRTPELCMLESTRVNEEVAIQLVANGSEFEDFLRFRDELRATPALIEKYNQLKISCADWPHGDYRDKKSVFIEQVLVRC